MNLNWSWPWQTASLPSSSHLPPQWAAFQLLQGPGHSSRLLFLPLQPVFRPCCRLILPCPAAAVVTGVGQEAGHTDRVTQQPTGLSQARDRRKKVWVCVGWRQKTPFLPKNIISFKPRGNRKFGQEPERAHLAKLWAFYYYFFSF